MKNTFVRLSLIALLITGTWLVSCEKSDDGDGESATVSMEDFVGTYMITSATVKLDGFPTSTDAMGILFNEECEQDDLITLNADSSVVYTDAGVQCDPPNNSTGTWYLTEDQKRVIIDNIANTKLEDLTDSSFIVSFDTTYNSVSGTVTVTFVKQP